MLMWVWRVTGSTRLQNLAVRRITVITVFNSSPGGYTLVSILNRMGKFASKFIGALVVKSQLFKLAKGVLSVA
eukprot:1161540-Pelagomonas_calceolata.AAC.1